MGTLFLNIRFIPILFLFFVGDAKSYCREYIDQDKASLNYTYVCQNSLKSPPYLIVRQYIDNIKFEIFEFDYLNFRLICSTIKLDSGKRYGGCDQYGVKSLQPQYKNGVYTIDVGLLSSKSISNLFSLDRIYRYPEFAEQVFDTGCVLVMATNKTIYWRYPENQPEKLVECLINFEVYATKNKIHF